MRLINYLGFLLGSPRFIVPTLSQIADVFRVRRSGRGTRLPPCPIADQEAAFFQQRAGWLIDHIKAHGLASAKARFVAMLSHPNLLEDAYSASQRIAKLSYLYQLGGRSPLELLLMARAHRDAIIVADHYEFRTNNTWFNNHLLNNYRALILYASFFMRAEDAPKIEAAIGQIGEILAEHSDTLFETPGEPILCEGSVSYEIHGLKILTDLVVCPYRTTLTNTWREWVVSKGKSVLMKYRYADAWLIPQIGDITPNWTPRTMIDFMDGLALAGEQSLYRAVWADEFKRIGL